MPSILIFGATGLIGAALTQHLVQSHPDWPITVYIRPGSHGAKGASVEYGTFEETEKISALSEKHDIVVNAGSSFDGGLVSAIIAGLKEKKGKKGVLVHISGGGNFIDYGTSGAWNPESKVWDDSKEEDIRLIKEMFNGASDTVVLGAGEEGVVDTYIVCPGVTYGNDSVGAHTLGIGYGLITSNAKSLGYVPYAGEGTALVGVTHVLDAVAFLTQVIELAAEGPAKGSAYSRYYMLLTETVAWKSLVTELAKVMSAKGLASSSGAHSRSIDQAGDGEVKYLMGAKCQHVDAWSSGGGHGFRTIASEHLAGGSQSAVRSCNASLSSLVGLGARPSIIRHVRAVPRWDGSSEKLQSRSVSAISGETSLFSVW